jgi:hypothetical protein
LFRGSLLIVIFGRERAVLAAAFVASCLAACGTTAQQADPVTTPEGPSEPEVTADPTSSPDDPKPIPPPKVTGQGTPASEAGTRELTQADCRTLAQKYGSLTRSDEEAKLSPKLTPTQRNTANGAIEKAAQTLADRWEAGCSRDLAGKYASEEALKCAMGSKSVSAFDVCLNGPAAPPPP